MRSSLGFSAVPETSFSDLFDKSDTCKMEKRGFFHTRFTTFYYFQLERKTIRNGV